jgi:hypothetical protein
VAASAVFVVRRERPTVGNRFRYRALAAEQRTLLKIAVPLGWLPADQLLWCPETTGGTGLAFWALVRDETRLFSRLIQEISLRESSSSSRPPAVRNHANNLAA